MYESPLSRSGRDLANAIGVDPYYVRWELVPELKTEALVLYAPWSRIVVARTGIGAERFTRDFQTGHKSWILDSLVALYPIEQAPPLPPPRLLEEHFEDPALSGFVRWGIRAGARASWPVTRNQRVIGSWANYRDAILLRHQGGRTSLRLRSPSQRLGPKTGAVAPRRRT